MTLQQPKPSMPWDCPKCKHPIGHHHKGDKKTGCTWKEHTRGTPHSQNVKCNCHVVRDEFEPDNEYLNLHREYLLQTSMKLEPFSESQFRQQGGFKCRFCPGPMGEHNLAHCDLFITTGVALPVCKDCIQTKLKVIE